MQFPGIVTTLAWRNLWRNHRRTLIMIAAVSIGVWAMIFMNALMRGMVDEMVRDGLESLPGHVQVHRFGFRDDPSINNLIPIDDRVLTKKLDRLELMAWSSRINVPAVVTSERESRGVTLYGIDPQRERDISFVAADIVAGRYLGNASDTGVVIGKKLMETLETGLGKRIVLMSQNLDNDIADRGFRIVGVFDAKLAVYEETMMFVGKKTLQEMLHIGDRVTEIAILGPDYRHVEATLKTIRGQLGSDVEILSWTDLNPYLASMLRVMDGFALVWTIVIFLALSFGLVNTLVMAVFERVREIGLMLALGMRPFSILAQVVVESLTLLAIGLAVGTTLAWVSIYPLQSGIDISMVAEGMEMFGSSSVLYPKLTIDDIVLANAVVLVLGFFASLSPAWRASRYEPIEAITKI